MKKLPQVRWYWFTRAVGGFTAIYELLVDHSTERGTIILAAFGLMGFDWVSRQAKRDDD